MPEKPVVVVGIDVGGTKKGFHAVALADGKVQDRTESKDAAEIAAWCVGLDARCIGVDAPCSWRIGEEKRKAERDLIRAKIQCFYTPPFERSDHGFYGWMRNGEELFRCLRRSHPLYGIDSERDGRWCFETFPQAVGCALAGHVVSAKEKKTIRPELLRQAGVDFGESVGIDFIDAALCALTAHRFARNEVEVLGEAQTGFIVVPRMAGSTLFARSA